MKLAEIKSNPDNPRIIRDAKFEQLKKSIQEFPAMLELRPMIIDAAGVVLGGNMRLRALQDLGYKEIPDTWVKRAEELTEDEKRRFIIVDNVGYGEWDWDAIANAWDSDEVMEWGLDVPGVFQKEVEAEDDDYEMPEQILTDIVVGDLFEIGPHRLLCGDSTDSNAVTRLIDGNKADMTFTDPPYDFENYAWTDFLFSNTNGHIFILNSEQRNVDISYKHRKFLKRWYAVDFRKAHLISNKAPMARVDFIAEFRTSENVKFVNLNKGFRTLIECLKNSSSKDEHKQSKNPELPATFIEHHTNKDELIFDFFLGSGTTMVAAHQLKRRCYGIELEPKYCQIIIDRMLKLDPTLEIKRNGVQYKTTQ